jgi:adenylate cyclase
MASVWLEGGSNGQRWPIGPACTIGRGQKNDIVLEDRQVSRRHALIHRQDQDEFWLVDLGSGNGSFVNSRRVTLSTRLRDTAAS